LYHEQGNVLFSALYCTNIALIESALLGKILLGKAAFPAQLRNSFPEFFAGFQHSINYFILSEVDTGYIIHYIEEQTAAQEKQASGGIPTKAAS
jgi:hypothetical protein